MTLYIFIITVLGLLVVGLAFTVKHFKGEVKALNKDIDGYIYDRTSSVDSLYKEQAKSITLHELIQLILQFPDFSEETDAYISKLIEKAREGTLHSSKYVNLLEALRELRDIRKSEEDYEAEENLDLPTFTGEQTQAILKMSKQFQDLFGGGSE